MVRVSHSRTQLVEALKREVTVLEAGKAAASPDEVTRIEEFKALVHDQVRGVDENLIDLFTLLTK